MPIANKLTTEDKKTIHRLKAAGVAEYKIAAMLGVAPNTIRYFLKKSTQEEATSARR